MQREVVTSSSAPEVRNGGSPSPASDVYSLGILMLQLLTGSEASGLLDHVQVCSQWNACNAKSHCCSVTSHASYDVH